MSDEVALKIVEILRPHGQVIISSEGVLSGELESYSTKVRPQDMLHLLAGARIFIGDSQTMAAEAGVLGTPFIRYNDFVGKIGYLDELENKYQLGYGIKTEQEASMMEAIESLLNNDQLSEAWKEKRTTLLHDKTDLSKLVVWFILKYPESLQRIRKNHMMIDETIVDDIY
jgi:predicted glycosyltransferase